MALKQEIKPIIDYVSKKQEYLEHNTELFDIYEGDLLQYVLIALRKQLNPDSFEQIRHRVSPINILKRLIDKLSKIYQEPPTRTLKEENQKDTDIFNSYLTTMDVDTNFCVSNEFFNLFKNCLIEPFVRDRKPAMRVIPSDRFLVWSTDQVDPLNPTHVIKFMGKLKNYTKRANDELDLWYLYTADEFLAIDSSGKIQQDILNSLGNPTGINPVGRLPFTYINRSRHHLCPVPDTDTLKMTKIFPVLLSDLNFAVMYQAFSIIFGIDVDTTNIKMSPNAFWDFKSDPSSKNRPEVGSIKPQVDIDQVMNYILAQLSFWLQSKNIRPGSTGTVSAENFSSGVSKVVDEMDTYEDRQKQVPFFKTGEEQFWDLIINGMHPYWVREGMIDEIRLFEPGQSVQVKFPDQYPMQSRMDLLTEIEKELELGLTTKKIALQKLNPDMSEQEIDKLEADIEEENVVETPMEINPAKQNGDGSVPYVGMTESVPAGEQQ